MSRHLAHFINLDGETFTMAFAEISDDRRSCRIMPFAGEIHSTRFHNGWIVIKKNAEGLYVIEEHKSQKN